MTRVSLRGMQLGIPTLRSGAAFSPVDVPDFVYWFDADSPDTLWQDSSGTTPATADGAVVGRWSDKTGASRHVTQATEGARPLLKTSVVNGRNVIRFDGVNDWMINSDIGITLSASTYYIVVRYDELPLVTKRILAPATGINQSIYPGGTNIGMSAGTALSAAAPASGTLLIVSEFNGANSRMLFNASVVATGNAGTGTSSSVQLAAATNGTERWWSGDFCEVLCYSRITTDSERAQISAYLNDRWNIYS